MKNFFTAFIVWRSCYKCILLVLFIVQDEFSTLVQQWNVQRSQALERCLKKILYPQMEKELRLKLITEAKEGIMKVKTEYFLCLKCTVNRDGKRPSTFDFPNFCFYSLPIVTSLIFLL